MQITQEKLNLKVYIDGRPFIVGIYFILVPFITYLSEIISFTWFILLISFGAAFIIFSFQSKEEHKQQYGDK